MIKLALKMLQFYERIVKREKCYKNCLNIKQKYIMSMVLVYDIDKHLLIEFQSRKHKKNKPILIIIFCFLFVFLKEYSIQI